MNIDKDKFILELMQKNQELYEVIDGLRVNYVQLREIVKNKDRLIHDLVSLAERAISKPTESIDQQLVRITNDYFSNCLFAKAKVVKDKRATFYLLSNIKKLVKNGRPITGAYAKYLLRAIDLVLTNRKQPDIKEAFLLNGTMSSSGRDTKIIRAVEDAIADGHGRHKTKGKKRDGAYLKVANDMIMSPSAIEAIYKGSKTPPNNEEFKSIISSEAEKLWGQMESLMADKHGLEEAAILNELKTKLLK